MQAKPPVEPTKTVLTHKVLPREAEQKEEHGGKFRKLARELAKPLNKDIGCGGLY
jgi:hypothetical protein